MNTDNTLSKVEEISPDSLEPIVRESLIIVALLGFMAIASLLPGIAMELPGTDIAVGDLVVAAGSLGIVASLIWIGPKLQTLATQTLDGPAGVVEDIGSIARNLALFAAVLVAHWGFAAVLRPLLEIGWAYDAAFLLLALIPLGIVAYRVYSSLDPLTDLLTSRMFDRPSERTGSNRDEGWS